MPSTTQTLTNAAAAAGVPPALLIAQAQQESGLNPNAYNAKSGATGLLQLLPATGKALGVSNLLDPVQNANGGARYLAQLYAQFGDWATALAAYDWGPGNVSRAIASYGAAWLSTAPAETQNYVASILDAAGLAAPVAELTPESVATGAAQAASDVADTVVQQFSSLPTVGTILILTGLGVAVYLLASDLE